ncbi:hypothetical protein [Sphingopyxis sp.]|uniref:hypothetical protein n=1 Tax=Sphingopyxis sp. TaxID=1908224 RepID=UPI003D0EE4DB
MAALIAILPTLVAGCSAPGDRFENVKTIAAVEALFHIDICEEARILGGEPTAFGAGTKELVIGFPNRSCVEEFFRAMKHGGRAKDIRDGKEYFRIIGGQENPSLLFAVDRIDDTSVMLRLIDPS